MDGGFTKSAINGATITVGTLTANSNEQGYFTLANVPVGQRVVNITMAGYLSVQRVIQVVQGENVHIPTFTGPSPRSSRSTARAAATPPPATGPSPSRRTPSSTPTAIPTPAT